MNKVMKRSLVLGLILCLILCAALLVACDPNTPKDDDKTTYNVTVTCEDSAALTNVKVQLKNSKGETVAEKPLDQGKATFELEAADYTVTLTGVPENYSYTDGALSATQTDCTITLNKPKYTVNINYPAIKDLYGNIVEPAGPAEGVTVDLYAGGLSNDLPATLEKATLAATKQTDATGKAEFDLDGDLYTVVLSGYKYPRSRGVGLQLYFPENIVVYTLSPTSRTYTAKFTDESTFIYGTTIRPLELKSGENKIDMSSDVIARVGMTGGVCYSFTPKTSGSYTFETKGAANAIISSDPYMPPILQGEGKFTKSLEGGKTYTYICGSALSTAHQIAIPYTFTITKDGEEGPEPTVNATPFTTFEGAHTVEINAGTSQDSKLTSGAGKIDPVWYSYTATENATYKISDPTKSLWMIVCEGEPNHDGQAVVDTFAAGDIPNDYITFEVKAGKTYYFWICTWSETPGTVSFKIEKM